MVIKVRYYNVDAYETAEGIVSSFDDILDIQGNEILDYE